MARYLLSVWHETPYVVDHTTPDAQRIGAKVGAFNERLVALGAMVDGAGLEPPDRAVVARLTGDGVEDVTSGGGDAASGVADAGEVVVTDGPMAAPLPAMGGFWIIDVDDHDLALELAREAARATEVPVELRPFQGD